MVRIPVETEKIALYCRRYFIRKLSLFGSVLRDDFRSDSDVDVLVEFFPGHVPGFLKIAEMERELSSLLGGRTVEIRTPGDLSRYFRDEVVESAETLYAQE
ncbi:MAG TPA: nucleotidyltransferase domain-containing protein [Candidatus Deferrimicrobiaceae bacterium]|jgi:predicted nucleotidyltransferase|nr:nucleotidyltransferase domain-containing protein [Candidatus Deferrimicrobiaceae bacterium]